LVVVAQSGRMGIGIIIRPKTQLGAYSAVATAASIYTKRLSVRSIAGNVLELCVVGGNQGTSAQPIN